MWTITEVSTGYSDTTQDIQSLWERLGEMEDGLIAVTYTGIDGVSREYSTADLEADYDAYCYTLESSHHD